VLVFQGGHVKEAMTTCDQVLDMDPQNTDALINRAEAHIVNENFDRGKGRKELFVFLRSVKVEYSYIAYLSLGSKIFVTVFWSAHIFPDSEKCVMALWFKNKRQDQQ
jgi:hypothetical protein